MNKELAKRAFVFILPKRAEFYAIRSMLQALRQEKSMFRGVFSVWAFVGEHWRWSWKYLLASFILWDVVKSTSSYLAHLLFPNVSSSFQPFMDSVAPAAFVFVVVMFVHLIRLTDRR